jgi:hypothetical protein
MKPLNEMTVQELQQLLGQVTMELQFRDWAIQCEASP